MLAIHQAVRFASRREVGCFTPCRTVDAAVFPVNWISLIPRSEVPATGHRSPATHWNMSAS